MRGFPLLVLWALQVAFVGCSGTDRCNSSDACERQDDVPLLQLKTHVEGCADELWKAAVRTIQHMDQTSPSESILMQAFEKGCNPKTSPLSKTECQEVQLAHERTYSQLIANLNAPNPPPMSFEDFAVIMMFNCMWHNRQDESDSTYVGKSFNVCPLEHICSSITTAKGYAELTGASGKCFSCGAEDLGWNGTGEVYPIVRVTLLHKSDGTASAPDTKLGTSGLRVSCINGGWALPCQLTVDGMKYSQKFQIAWGPQRDGMRGMDPLSLESTMVRAPPGRTVADFSDTGVAAKMPPAAGNPITMVIIGDPCNGNMRGFGQCNFRAFYGVNRTLPRLLNAALNTSDIWYLTGDNFYDRYGLFSVSLFAQLNKEAQAVPLLATPGNHDYWFNGVPSLAANSWLLGYDQFANGQAQFFAQDSKATFEPEAPASNQIYPSCTPVENFSALHGGFLNFAASPSDDAKPENFYHYSIAGNIGFVMFTCIGADPRDFVSEACTFMKQKDPKLVLFLGHWNMAGSGCPAGRDVPTVTKWALENTNCSAFKGSQGQTPFGQIGRAASRLKFIVGHAHCNCMTNFEQIAQDSCLSDAAGPSLVDGFLIGSHGMSWDPYPGASPKCSSRFGLPVLRTDDDKLTFAYAKLSEDVMPDKPITLWQLYYAFIGGTPDEWKFEVAGEYGAGILKSNMTALLSCLKENGTNQCSRNTSLFDQWYSADLV